jgi:uncharacterized protein (TIRG00374 family)
MTAKNQTKWIGLVKIILAAIILYLLVKTSQLHLQLLGNVFQQPTYLLAFSVIFFTIVLITAWRWQLLNNAQPIALSFKKTLKLAFIGGAFNTLLPGAVGGDFMRWHYLSKIIPHSKSIILLSVLFDRVIGLIGILITLFIAAALHITFFAAQPTLSYLLLAILCACASLFTVIVTLMIYPQRLGLSIWLKQRYPEAKWAALIANYLDIFRQYRIPLPVLIKTIIISTIVEYLVVSALLIIAKMMGLPPLVFSHAVLALGITLLVSVIPITPGGIGVGEMAFANVLLLLNPGSTIAYATIYLAYRLLSMLAYLPAVLFYLPKLNELTANP